jgi:integrase
MSESHSIFDDRIKIYKRDDGRYWQCSACIKGTNHRASTKEDSLQLAKEFAEDWYLELRGKLRRGELVTEKKFKEAAAQFEREYEIITQGQRNARYVGAHKARLKNYVLPFFGEMALSEVSGGTLQEYRIWRQEHRVLEREKKKKKDDEERIKPPARSTIHQEVVVIRQVLKTAVRHKWLDKLPDLSEPYGASKKISHRAWFSNDEYKKLYEATRKRAANPPKKRFAWQCEQLHDFVLFMANTGLRPDEALRLEHRDVVIVYDEGVGERILEISVRGKRGVGYCKSMPGAVTPYRRLLKRAKPKGEMLEGNDGKDDGPQYPQPTDRLFPNDYFELFNRVLAEEGLKLDREGRPRTAYSLRHTYICFRLMEGADIYQVAKNCRTSVEMIQKYYAAHLKTNIDAAAVNVRKSKLRKSSKPSEPPEPELRP